MANTIISKPVLRIYINKIVSQKYPRAMRKTVDKNKMVEDLDKQISLALIDCLSDAQYKEFNDLLDRDEPIDYGKFFKNCGIDVQQVIRTTMDKYGDEFMKNA